MGNLLMDVSLQDCLPCIDECSAIRRIVATMRNSNYYMGIRRKPCQLTIPDRVETRQWSGHQNGTTPQLGLHETSNGLKGFAQPRLICDEHIARFCDEPRSHLLIGTIAHRFSQRLGVCRNLM